MNRDDYERADSFLPWNSQRVVFRATVEPHWIADGAGTPGPRFWYRNRTRRGHEFVLVDPSLASRSPAFDHDRLAEALSAATGSDCAGATLPFRSIEFVGGAAREALEFDIAGQRWRCDLATYACSPAGPAADGERSDLLSPDGRYAVFVRDHDLYARVVATGEEFALTEDGEPFYDYGGSPESNISTVTSRRLGIRLPPVAIWSPDSSRIVAHRLDQRQVKELHLIQAVPPDGSARPILHTRRYPMLGDEQTAMSELLVLDVRARRRVAIQRAPEVVPVFSALEMGRVWWSQDGDQVYTLEFGPGNTEARLCEADASTGAARVVIEEQGNRVFEPNLFLGNRPNIRQLSCGREIIWFSERDGWGHLYLYDGQTGQTKNRITSGPWVVRDIIHVDEKDRWVYFTGGGREAGRDPYYRHLYRAKLDGGGLELLSPEDADHEIIASPDGRFFIDTFGRVDTAPVSLLRAADGQVVCGLEEADFDQLHARGWRFPEPFAVKAGDGVTDLYGSIYFPTNFDPERKYPVIDDIYNGSQMITTLKSYAANPRNEDWFWLRQSIAELGFIVVTLDARGTAFRSKAFHNFSRGRVGMAAGVADHAVAIRQLAAQRPYMDLERVGVYGFSAGGYAAARAMFDFPDLFKVGVSGCGSHDMRCYMPMPSKGIYPDPEGIDYAQYANQPWAANLKGKLLLMHGELDDNVPPAHTLKLVNALIEANKDFDLLILPNLNHAIWQSAYCLRRIRDYFVQHLASQTPPGNDHCQAPGADSAVSPG